jgi:hypothetical protein
MPVLLTYVLLTHAGTRLYARGAGLGHAAPAEAETNLVIQRDGETLRLEAPGIAAWNFIWRRAPGRTTLRLSGPQGFLHIAADGETVLTPDAADDTGLFLLLSDPQHADLVYVTRHRWAMALPLAKSRPPETGELLHGFRLRVCGCDIQLDRPQLAFPRIWRLNPPSFGDRPPGEGAAAEPSPGEIIFQYGDFLVGRARLYNPLIYLCAFGDALVFSMLALFLESLERFGAYDGHILILSDREPLEIARITPAALRPRTHMLKLDYATAAEFATVRYRVASHAFAGFQPMLYADCGTVAASPVAPLLADLVQQNGICFASAYHDTRNTQTVAEETLNLFGRPIFAADPDWSGRINCLDTGLIGFTRIAEAERIFPLILAVIAQYAAHGAEKLRAMEPGAASYVVQKLAASQADFLNRYVQVLNHNPPDPAVRHFSLVRLNHPINNAKKLDMMRKYLAALEARAADPGVPAGPTAIPGVI